MLKLIYLFTIVSLLFSCKVNSDVMYRIPKGDEYIYDSMPKSSNQDYRLAKDDKFTFIVSPNHGKRILDGSTGTVSSSSSEFVQQEYVIQSDGMVELPLLGAVNLVGKTVVESQEYLKELYSQHYIDPFLQIKLTNQRVIVFPGDGGSAKVLNLDNRNTTLMEVLAKAGGISNRGRADQIKLMRIENNVRKVYSLDLSKIEGLLYGDIIVQANDYIYVEPKLRDIGEVLTKYSPVIITISTVLILFDRISNLIK